MMAIDHLFETTNVAVLLCFRVLPSTYSGLTPTFLLQYPNSTVLVSVVVLLLFVLLLFVFPIHFAFLALLLVTTAVLLLVADPVAGLVRLLVPVFCLCFCCCVCCSVCCCRCGCCCCCGGGGGGGCCCCCCFRFWFVVDPGCLVFPCCSFSRGFPTSPGTTLAKARGSAAESKKMSQMRQTSSVLENWGHANRSCTPRNIR